jgi:hypothetical protein
MKPLIFETHIPVPTAIGISILPHYDLHSTLLRNAFAFCNDNDYMNEGSTNVQSKHTPYRTHNFYPELEQFNSLVSRAIDEYFITSLGFPHSVPTKCTESWIIEYNSGDMTRSHCHYPNMISATYYYDVEDQTPIMFESYQNGTVVNIPVVPTDGMLIIFPSYVRHSVPRCNGKRGTWASNWVYDFTVQEEAFDKNNVTWQRYKENLSKSQN